MQSKYAVVVGSGSGPSFMIIGNGITIKIHGRDTNGTLSVIETADQPGEGPPPHIQHREDETFYVLEGEYEFLSKDRRFTAKRGATVFAPRGVPHTYKNISQAPGKLLVAITP